MAPGVLLVDGREWVADSSADVHMLSTQSVVHEFGQTAVPTTRRIDEKDNTALARTPPHLTWLSAWGTAPT